MPVAVSICLSVVPEAPFATMPSALRMDTGESSTLTLPERSSRKRDRAKSVTASPPAVRSVVVSITCGSKSAVSSCARTPQPDRDNSSTSASTSVVMRFVIGSVSFQKALVCLDGSRREKVSPARGGGWRVTGEARPVPQE